MLAAAVVLGLSVTLAKHQVVGSPPAETSFGSFTGGFGIFAAAIGIVAVFFEAIPSVVPLALDALASIFLLAGGIALTLAMNVSCTSTDRLGMAARLQNRILSGGCSTGDLASCGIFLEGGRNTVEAMDAEAKARCVRTQADFAFQYIGFIAALASLLVTFLGVRKSGSKVFA